MTFRRSLSSTKREELYNAEALKAREAGRGELPICVHCDLPIDGKHQRWNEAHDPHKPLWLGGAVVGIAHQRCNFKHNNEHDTPLFHKSNRTRRKFIGAQRSLTPMQGGRDDPIKKKMTGEVVERATGRVLSRGRR
jgi:hypothetical protein